MYVMIAPIIYMRYVLIYSYNELSREADAVEVFADDPTVYL